MLLQKLPNDLTICKVADIQDIPLQSELFFVGKTDEELSLVCNTEDTPRRTLSCDDGWKGFRIQGELDFSLTGILAKISAVLAQNGIAIFAISTYNTDYVLVKKENFEAAMHTLQQAGYEII